MDSHRPDEFVHWKGTIFRVSYIFRLRLFKIVHENDLSIEEIFLLGGFAIFRLIIFQVLAINRGESQKILSVKINVPEFILKKFTGFCKDKFMYYNLDKQRKKIFDESITDSYTRLSK